MWSIIDSHIHCRGDCAGAEESESDYIAHALKVAEDSGVAVVVDKGNLTCNPVTSMRRAKQRMTAALDANSPVLYLMYMMLTNHPDQNREAVETVRKYFPKKGDRVGVVGINMFAGPSTGGLEITTEEEQLAVDSVVASTGYTGLYTKHCEDPAYFKKRKDGEIDWDTANPVTWSIARTQASEFLSVSAQIANAIRVKAKYHLHILHASVPDTVRLVYTHKKISTCPNMINVTCEVAPRNLILSSDALRKEDGLFWKTNPPLRSEGVRQSLIECVIKGLADTLASDHSPHTLDGKLKRYASGAPGLADWPYIIPKLIAMGISPDLIDRMLWQNPVRIFGLEHLELQRAERPLVDHRKDYAFNLYEDLQ